MQIFLNGRFVPEEQAVVSVLDRSFLYGDGLFETMLVLNGKPFRWDQHLERLARGAEFLKIKIPFKAAELRDFVAELVSVNSVCDALLRLTLSRGVGPRGYSPKGAESATVVMSLHPLAAPICDTEGRISAPDRRWNLITSSFRLPAGEAVAQFKTCNKLTQIMARMEADAAGADEALLLNTNGQVVEASTSNLFWIERDTVCTPPLASGILAGVTRAVVLDVCRTLRLEFRETETSLEQLKRAQGVFLSLSSLGVVEAAELDQTPLTSSPLVARIRSEYWKLVQQEVG